MTWCNKYSKNLHLKCKWSTAKEKIAKYFEICGRKTGIQINVTFWKDFQMDDCFDGKENSYNCTLLSTETSMF